jgi:hypothetical protein
VNVNISRADQIDESDMHFITRLAEKHGATATMKDGKLIVATRGKGESGSSRPLSEITLLRSDLSSYSLTFPDRDLYGGTNGCKFAFELAVQIFLRVVLRRVRRQKEPFDLVPMPSKPFFYEPRVVDFQSGTVCPVCGRRNPKSSVGRTGLLRSLPV